MCASLRLCSPDGECLSVVCKRRCFCLFVCDPVSVVVHSYLDVSVCRYLCLFVCPEFCLTSSDEPTRAGFYETRGTRERDKDLEEGKRLTTKKRISG